MNADARRKSCCAARRSGRAEVERRNGAGGPAAGRSTVVPVTSVDGVPVSIVRLVVVPVGVGAATGDRAAISPRLPGRHDVGKPLPRENDQRGADRRHEHPDRRLMGPVDLPRLLILWPIILISSCTATDGRM